MNDLIITYYFIGDSHQSRHTLQNSGGVAEVIRLLTHVL